MSKKVKVLFCNAFKAPYIETEKNIFQENFNTTFMEYKIKKTRLGKIWNIIDSILKTISNVPKVDVVYAIFGGFHGFFPILLGKMLKKKTIITVGGYDAVNIPSIQFGIFYQNNFLTWCIKKQYQWADYILPVDESLELSTNYYADPTSVGYPNGIRNFVNTKAKIITLPFGYDDNKFQRNRTVEHKNSVISIGWATTHQVFQRKGFDLVFEVASIMPDIEFTIIGVSKKLQQIHKTNTPKNVKIYEFLDHETIINLLSQNRIFLQLSLSEGLPNTLCEAMLCECIPIGSDVNGIPKAIGDTGYILKEKNVEKLKQLIYNALSLDIDFGKKARHRISSMFPLSNRSKFLKNLIEN